MCYIVLDKFQLMNFPDARIIVSMLVGLVLSMHSTAAATPDTVRISSDLYLLQLKEGIYIHVSTLRSEQFGIVSCNGIVYIDRNDALIFDTPADSIQTVQLLKWIKESRPEIVIKGLVINHFHNDCVAGLGIFHEAGIPSYSSTRTRKTLKDRGDANLPGITFKKKFMLQVGDGSVINYYPGPAHTRDNIVSYLANEKILFGGCPVKALGAGKGNIADADLKRYSKTIEQVKKKFHDARVVVPGHGKHGTTELLDYTIKLFRN